jgi:N-acetylmuramic acid 6-phosphate (MurNAc-6-P) etherase
VSITETSNEVTEEIDVCNPKEILRILRQCDQQIFSGWRQYPGIFDDEILAKVEFICQQVKEVIARESSKSAIVISGSGTSGRLAFFCCRQFNKLLQDFNKPPIFHYLIAGGDRYIL